MVRVISYVLGGGALLVSGAALLVGLLVTGRERRITLLGELVAGGAALLAAPLFMWLSGGRLVWWLLLPAGGLGLALGAGRGITLPLRHLSRRLTLGRQSRLLFLLWGAALLLSQLAALSGISLLLSLALLPLLFATGAQLGVHGILLLRRAGAPLQTQRRHGGVFDGPRRS